MNAKTRLISLVLIAMMLLSAFSGVAMAADLPFDDVALTDWFYDDVSYVYRKDMMNGVDENTFAPDTVMTRGMIVTILHRLEDCPMEGAAPFGDVAAGQYYAAAVAWANKTGIVKGYGDGSFGPNDPITREQLAAVLFRYAEYCGKASKSRDTLSDYEDADEISAYAMDAMQWACYEKLLQGNNGELDPKGCATRAQAAAVLNRFTGESGLILPGLLLPGRDHDDDNDNDDDDRDVQTYTVTFHGNIGEMGVYEEQTVEENHCAEMPYYTPCCRGYLFAGWSVDADEEEWYDFSRPVTEDLDLYAHWVDLGHEADPVYATLYGTVVEEDSGDPIEDVKVFAYRADTLERVYGVNTNEAGQFDVKLEAGGIYYVTVYYNGIYLEYEARVWSEEDFYMELIELDLQDPPAVIANAAYVWERDGFEQKTVELDEGREVVGFCYNALVTEREVIIVSESETPAVILDARASATVFSGEYRLVGRDVQTGRMVYVEETGMAPIAPVINAFEPECYIEEERLYWNDGDSSIRLEEDSAIWCYVNGGMTRILMENFNDYLEDNGLRVETGNIWAIDADEDGVRDTVYFAAH